MTDDKPIIPLFEVRRDLTKTRDAIGHLKFNILPYMSRQIKWRFLGFWAPLWCAIFSYGGMWMQGLVVILGILFVRHCMCTLDCYTTVRHGEERLNAILDYLKEHYPNEKE